MRRASAPRRSRFAAAVLVVALGPAGCVDSERRPMSSPPPPEASTTERASTTEPESPTTTEPDSEPVVLAFAGDIHFEGGLRNVLRSDPARLFAGVGLVFEDSDLVVANLETAITERGTPAEKSFTFRAPREALGALADAGVDVIGMANNHALDYGPEGLVDTLAAADESPVPVVGIGVDEAAALRPALVDVKGRRIAVLAATDVMDAHLVASWTAVGAHPGVASAKRTDELVEAVRSARAEADTVVVFLHWGIETETCPSGRQKTLARRLVDAGADVVVGGHAHRVQGAGFIGGAAVGYGLGNFVFKGGSAAGRSSGILRVTVDRREVMGIEWVPARIDATGIPKVLMGSDANAATDAWLGLQGCAGLADVPTRGG
ncbi:MAG: CapA family protein [Microthrixaceae bacterium]|nr:CapA family protein [Microthrixaceae bacterium]